MSSLADINLDSAVGTYGIANTPAFLWMRLPRDPAVQRIARELSEDEIFNELRQAVDKSPETLADFAMPYILLAALALRRASSSLEKAAVLDGSRFPWFHGVRQALIQTHPPTMILSLDTPSSAERAQNVTSKRVLFLE